MADDGHMLELWRAGDAEAGNRLFERHFDGIYRFFANKVGEDATDLVQRTFLACIEGQHRFEGRSSFRTYLFAIARHELFGHWRRRRSEEIDASLTSIAALDDSPSRVLVKRFEERLLLEGLRSIPLDLQVVLELRYWEEMTMEEIAEVVGVPVGTAKSRMRRAREALASAMASLEEDPARVEATLQDLDGWARGVRRALLGDE